MKLRMMRGYAEFRCAGGDCPDTCCRDWEVVLDAETAAFYRTVPGELGRDIRRAMTARDGEPCLFLKDGLCPMLNAQGLCRIQLGLGEAHLCHSCDQHPRFAEEYGALREWSLSLACPEAVRLLLDDPTPMTFLERTDDEPVSACNNLKPQLYFALLSSRKTAFSLAQDRALPWQTRARRLLAFAEALQNKLDQHRVAALETVTVRFSQGRMPRTLPAAPEGARLLERLSALEPINSRWPELLSSARRAPEDRWPRFLAETAEGDYAYEHLLVYFLYRYWLKAVNDRALLPRARFAVRSVFAIQALEYAHWRQTGALTREDRMDLIHRYSREVEHSAANLAAVCAWQPLVPVAD